MFLEKSLQSTKSSFADQRKRLLSFQMSAEILLNRLPTFNGGCNPEKKDCREQHRPLVSVKNIDEARLSLLNIKKLATLRSFFCKTIL